MGGHFPKNAPDGGHCSRWFFTFNGKECSDPEVIDFVDFHSFANIKDVRPSQCKIPETTLISLSKKV